MDSKINPDLAANIIREGAGRLPWASARVDGDPDCVSRAEFWPTLDVRLVVERGPGIVPSSPLQDVWYIEHPEPANPSGRGVKVSSGFDGAACYMVQNATAPWVPEAVAVISRLLHNDRGELGYVGGRWGVQLAVAFKPKANGTEEA